MLLLPLLHLSKELNPRKQMLHSVCYMNTVTNHFPCGLVGAEEKFLASAPPMLTRARQGTTFQMLAYPTLLLHGFRPAWVL